MSLIFPSNSFFNECRASKLFPLIIRLSVIVSSLNPRFLFTSESRVKLAQLLLPSFVYFLTLQNALGAKRLSISSFAKVSLKKTSLLLSVFST